MFTILSATTSSLPRSSKSHRNSIKSKDQAIGTLSPKVIDNELNKSTKRNSNFSSPHSTLFLVMSVQDDSHCETDVSEGGEVLEQDEDTYLKSNSDDNSSSELSKTVTSFGDLVVDKYIKVNEERNNSLNSTPVPVSNQDRGKFVNKRARSANTTPSESTNPAKKHCPIINMLPNMAEVLKADDDGHMMDIVSLKEDHPLTRENSDAIKAKITTALFSEVDISNIKFEPPYFDGTKMRIICRNDASKKWLLDTVLKLGNEIEGISFGTKELGVPPKMFTVNITMPAKSYEPPVLFSIITAQNSIDTTFWRYKSRTKVVNGRQTWYIAVDEASLKQLKELGYRPFVGLDRIKFNVQNESQK